MYDEISAREKKVATSLGVVCSSCNTAYVFNLKKESFIQKKTCLICKKEKEDGILVEDFEFSLSGHMRHHYVHAKNNDSGLPLKEILKRFTYDSEDFLVRLSAYMCSKDVFFDESKHYIDIVDDEFIRVCVKESKNKWERIATELKHYKRFSHLEAVQHFGNLISGCKGNLEKEKIDSDNLDSKDQILEQCEDVYHEETALNNALTILKKGTKIYRARIVKDADEREKIISDSEKQLGAPPEKNSQNNRMSPSGISFLYAAESPDTAIAEVHPYKGDEVAVGTFVLDKDLRFFDFSLLPNTYLSPPNLLTHPKTDMFYRDRHIIKFLQDLIAKPFRATDTSYIETQVFAEVIRNHHHKYDGLIFKSTQTDNKNIIIFGDINEVTNDKSYSVSLNIHSTVDFYEILGIQVSSLKKSP
ncbi:RES family NAD+ phosphorylase [Pantoea ananatis]|uniref:RES family NAD+ phosphorylase n=1 Tax=Pantoea ananas TaxID=553 RepID=UPI0013003F9C|nr:RES family NAD+ phosphorylase [Pantoea ananatis]